MSILKVELADTPSQQAQGLMFRKELGDSSGMLFRFSSPNVLNFWGLNTYIPLDIAFVSENGKIIKIDNISPLSTKAVSSEKECRWAIEANMGFFSKNGISVGDEVELAEDEHGFHIMSFKEQEGKEIDSH
jgi:uncharacterized protein